MAVMVVALFVLGTISFAEPVKAHFTLGDTTPTYRYHANDFDPHVAGVIGYAWPGAGQNSYAGNPGIAKVNFAPGYQSPYPGGKPPSTASAAFTGGAPTSWYQLEGDAYSPFGAVLTASTGDLIFAINATCTSFSQTPTPPSQCFGVANEGWDTIAIYIPSGFTVPDPSYIVSTVSNDYAGINVTKAGPFDRYAPDWSVVYVEADTITNAATIAGAVGGSLSVSPGLYYNHQFINFTAAGEWYYVRVNGVKAPAVAGRYFFKIALVNNSPASFGEQVSQFIPSENWPVLLVKGEIDPAIITGTIRYGSFNQTLYNQPIGEAGAVYANMTMRLDPYTGQPRPDLPTVDAVGYFNATANGHYEVEGLAPGVYDLYAESAGCPESVIASSVTVLKGQSLHFDGYLQPGPVIEGDVFSKHQFGDEPWPVADPPSLSSLSLNTYIKIEIYDRPTLNHKPDRRGRMASWSPLPCVAGGQEQYFNGRHAGKCGDPRLGGQIAFPWHEYTNNNGYFSGLVPWTPSLMGFYGVATGASGASQSAKMTQDPQGVGPPQHWYVQGGTTTPFHFQFGSKGQYGAPKDLSGMVPQLYATWINGLTPGRYCVRAWIFRYVQSAIDGSTFQEYCFNVTPRQWPGSVRVPIDLRLSSWVNMTLHFHNVINGITEDPIDTGASMMSGVLVDAKGNVWSYNQSLLGHKGLYTTGPHSGVGKSAFYSASTVIQKNDLDRAKSNKYAIETGRANIQFWGWNDTWGGENYGIPAGTYRPHVFVLGYLDDTEDVSVTLSDNPTSISDHMYRGAGFNVTVYSIDWQRPQVSRNWVWGNPTGYLPFQGFSFGSAAGGCGVNGQPGNPPNQCLVGQEIDVGFYMNGRLVNLAGDTPWRRLNSTPSTITTSCLYQNYTTSAVQMCGGGWDAQKILPSGAYVDYQGNTNDAFFGVDMSKAGFVGGYTDETLNIETADSLFAPAHYSAITLNATTDVEYNDISGYTDLYPTAMPPGQYDLREFTYGYIQNRPYTVYVTFGQVANMRINLMIGVNITLDVLFKKQHIISPTGANMSARVRLFNDQGSLVAEWMSSEGTYVTRNGFARAADGTTQYPFGNLPAIPLPKPLSTYDYLPGGTTLLHVLMAGLPAVPGGGQQVGPPAYGRPKGTYYGDPVVSTTITCQFGIDCFGNPGSNWSNLGFFPNYGIPGSPDYQGGWTAEVDFVNWYANNTKATVWEGGTPFPNVLASNGAQYYPPIAGLLMGESYHIIAGTAAKSGISFTEDLAIKLLGLATMAPNHLGPYSQEGVWQMAGARLSGGASGIFEVDLNGFVSGNALAFTWSNEFRPLSWGTITVTGAGLPSSGLNFYTYDGVYEAYLPVPAAVAPGSVSYKFTLGSPGLTTQSWTVAVSSGQTGTGANLYLAESKIPVPEFNGIAVVAFSALAASLYLLRRRRK
jgi:hypothetical protein